MPHERERQRKIDAIEAELVRQAKRTGVVMALVALFGALALALLLGHLFDGLDPLYNR